MKDNSEFDRIIYFAKWRCLCCYMFTGCLSYWQVPLCLNLQFCSRPVNLTSVCYTMLDMIGRLFLCVVLLHLTWKRLNCLAVNVLIQSDCLLWWNNCSVLKLRSTHGYWNSLSEKMNVMCSFCLCSSLLTVCSLVTNRIRGISVSQLLLMFISFGVSCF
jgi:hypothetical protein